MAKELEIDGVRFESSASIAQRFNYTQDYVGKLARDGKVSASKVGRFWFLDVASFEKFIEDSEKEKKERSEALREERRLERVPVAQAVAAPVKSFSPRRVTSQAATEQYVALTQAVAVVFCGLLVGALGWNAQGMEVVELQEGAGAIAGQFKEVFAMTQSSDVRSITQSAATAAAVQEAKVFATFPVQEYEMALPQEEVDETQSRYPFSDAVVVVREEDGVQIVRPLFEGMAEGVEYRVSAEAFNADTQ